MFKGLQTVLAAKLATGREFIEHPGTKGAVTELHWHEMLRALPQRYQVETAFIVDAFGGVSDQIDLVIFDRQYSPLLFSVGEAKYVPAESVYAVFEVRQALNKPNVDYAADKAASVRRLRRTSAQIQYAAGTYAPRPLFKICCGILTLDSEWNPPLGKSLRDVLDAQDNEHRLDLGCSLKHGSFDVAEVNSRFKLQISPPTEALVFFFVRLVKRLQDMGTVPAIDLNAYGAGLQWTEV